MIVDGFAEKESVGGAGTRAFTVTVTEREMEPPGPEQVRLYVVVEAGNTQFRPDVGCPPPQPPEAEQFVVFKDDQESCELFPAVIVDGFAEKESVGAGGGMRGATENEIDLAELSRMSVTNAIAFIEYNPGVDGAGVDPNEP